MDMQSRDCAFARLDPGQRGEGWREPGVCVVLAAQRALMNRSGMLSRGEVVFQTQGLESYDEEQSKEGTGRDGQADKDDVVRKFEGKLKRPQAQLCWPQGAVTLTDDVEAVDLRTYAALRRLGALQLLPVPSCRAMRLSHVQPSR